MTLTQLAKKHNLEPESDLYLYRTMSRQLLKIHMDDIDALIGDSRVGITETRVLQELWKSYNTLIDLWDSGTSFILENPPY